MEIDLELHKIKKYNNDQRAVVTYGIMKCGPTMWACGPTLHYSVDIRMQTYTEPFPLKYGKQATKYPWIYGYFYSVRCQITTLGKLFTHTQASVSKEYELVPTKGQRWKVTEGNRTSHTQVYYPRSGSREMNTPHRSWHSLLGPFHGAIAVPSVTRCRCRRCRGHRCAGGARQYR